MSHRSRYTRALIALGALPVLAGAAAAAGITSPSTRLASSQASLDAVSGMAGTEAVHGAAAGTTGGAQRGAAGAAAGSSATWQVLSQDVIPGLSNLVAVGTVPATQAMQVGVALHDPSTAAEEAAARAVYDVHSAQYHHFYTPAQWQQRFAIPTTAFDSSVEQLTAGGLRVAYASPMRNYLTLAGTAAQVQRTFGVTLNRYSVAGAAPFFANANPPRVPAAISAVLGLESLTNRLPSRRVPVSSTHDDTCVQGDCIGTLTPSDLWSIYGQPSSNRGQGQKVAVIGEGDMAQPVTDLRTWESRFSLPQVPVKEFAVADDQSDTSGLTEWNIDTQASTGMAPDALELDLYFGESLGVTAGPFSVWANDASGPLQANASFGGCESVNLALGDIQAEEPIFRQAAAEGRTLFVSTGDTGGSCTAVTGNGILNTVVPQVEWPASSNWVVAVGGTELFASSGGTPHRVVEKAWEYTGGGTSLTMPAQPWQTGIPAVAGRCLVDDTDAPQTSAPVCRGLPDVAAVSGDTLFNSYAITTSGADNFGAGTSLSSPLWAGMWTRIQAAAPAAGLGFAAPSLYRQGLDAATDAGDFFDVQIGDNGQFPALPRSSVDPSGWDYVSGLGVPNVGTLMSDLTGALTPSDTTAPIGGGGSSSSSGGCGGSNGTMTAPDGNQPFVAAAASVTKVVPSFDSAASAITVTFTVPQMSSGTRNELDFFYFFFYGGTEYELDASYDPNLGNSFALFDFSNVAGTASATDLTGGFDFSTGTATITMLTSDFNSVIHPVTPMGAGSVLDDTTASSGFEYDGFGGTISSGQCPFTL